MSSNNPCYNCRKMKFLVLLTAYFINTATLCQAQQDKSVDKLNRSITGILFELNSFLKDCRVYSFALKIEYKDLKITDISLSDSVDSLYMAEFIKLKDELDFTELNSYLKANNLRSAVFIKPIYYGLYYSWCESAPENLNDLNNSMRFKGIEFTGNNIRLKPHVMTLRAAH